MREYRTVPFLNSLYDCSDNGELLVARRLSSMIVTALLILTSLLGCGQKTKTIHEAAGAGNVEEVRRHLQEGAAVNATDEQGGTSLHWAIKANSAEVVQILLTHGANPNAKDKDGNMPLHLSSDGFHNQKLAELLIKNGAEVNAKNLRGATPLGISLFGGTGNEARLLLQHGAEWTIHAAAALGNVQKLQEFLAHGINPDSIDYRGWTPLHYAIEHQKREATTLILGHRASSNIQDKTGQTPLHRAAVFGLFEEAKMLLAHGADPNVTDEQGKTPLEFVRTSLRFSKSRASLPQRDVFGTKKAIQRYEVTEELLRQVTKK